MARLTIRLTSIILFTVFTLFAGIFAAHSDSSRLRTPRSDASYRNPTDKHKVIVQAEDQDERDSLVAQGGALLEDYGAFSLVSAPLEPADRVTAESKFGSGIRDDLNVLHLRAGAFDTVE